MEKVITKNVLAETLKQRGTFTTKASARRALEDVLEVITAELADGTPVKLLGFGAFLVKDVPERMGINPTTGEPITLKAHKKIVFKPGKLLKERIQG